MQTDFRLKRIIAMAVILISICTIPSCKIFRVILGPGGNGGGGGVSDYEGHNIPLNEPARFDYKGLRSGLYPWGNDLITNNYRSDYISVCQGILPVNNNGTRDESGKVVAVGIGASNPAIVFDGFKNVQRDDNGFGKDFVFINGALNAQDLAKILSPTTDYWDNVRRIISDQGYSNASVQVVFCMEDNLKNKDTTFQRAYDLKNDFISLLAIVRREFPNCKLFLVEDRGYTGYTTDIKHIEPKGYLNGWGVKLFVDDYTQGKLPETPFVNWLDYYWANGNQERFDGMTFKTTDFKSPQYVHFTQEKGDALAGRTHERLKDDVGAKYWYK